MDSKTTLFKALETTIASLDVVLISEERKLILQQFINYIQSKVTKQETIRLNFICTHNSRRSHLSQIWAQCLAAYFKIPNVVCYSGGTEATALYPLVVNTLAKSGFEITVLSEGSNPIYAINYSENEHPIIGFSKLFDARFNPKASFAAVMTCSHADENCPFIPGAEKRIPLTYDDPKEFDHTPLQSEKYEERSLQIARELNYVFSNIKIN
tara:strand:- start:11962 stop:12594 length:633 start_codon:yes stop_codon:yes gene_type:complete